MNGVSGYWHAPLVSRAVLRRLVWRFTRVDKSGLLAGHLFQRHLATQVTRFHGRELSLAVAFVTLDAIPSHYAVLGIKEANRLLETVNRRMVEESKQRRLRVFGPGPGQYLLVVPATETSTLVSITDSVAATEGLLRQVSFSAGVATTAEEHTSADTALPAVLIAQRTVARARTRMQRILETGGNAVSFPASAIARERGLVLLLDADELHAEMMKELLRKEGMRLVHKRDGSDAVALCRETHPDAILCDSALPVRNPVDLYRELRRDAATAEIPFIVLTRIRDELTLKTFLDEGILHIIGKPYLPVEISGLLKAFLARSQ